MECPRCGGNHEPVSDDPHEFSGMTVGEFHDAVSKMSFDKFMCCYPGATRLAGALGTVVATNCNPWDFIAAVSMVFGTVAFDAEMQQGLHIDANEKRTLPTFEDRVNLFTLIARKSYDKTAQDAKEDPTMFHGDSKIS